MGARKQQPMVPRLTTRQDVPCTVGMSTQDRHSTPRLAIFPLWAPHTNDSFSTQSPGPRHPGALPETYQGVDGFGPTLGLYSTQGAAGQAVRCDGGEHEEASSQHQPLPHHSSWLFLLGKEIEKIMKSVITYSVGYILSLQSSHQLMLTAPQANILVPILQMRIETQRGTVGTQAKGQGKELTCSKCLLWARSFPIHSHAICTIPLLVGCDITQTGKWRLREGKRCPHSWAVDRPELDLGQSSFKTHFDHPPS